MAYVRRRGNQLAIVHGVRDRETREVRQEILLTLYSKAEARAALGEDAGDSAHLLEQLLANRHPELRLDWKRLRKQIKAELAVLPDTYDHDDVRRVNRFRGDLVAFARQLMITDPQWLLPANRLIQEHRGELQYITDLIAWRLKIGPQEAGDFNQDNPFYWRYALPGRRLPPDVFEHAIDLFQRGDLERAEVAFRLATECFPDDSIGWRYFGVIALKRGDVESAIRRLQKAIDLARRRLPKRLPSRRAANHDDWRDHERGLAGLVTALSRAGRHDEARETCERLRRDGADAPTVGYLLAFVHLQAGRWKLALDAAEPLRRIWPCMSFVAGFAAAELHEPDQARESLIHAALSRPRTAAILAGEKVRPKPEGWEVADHNECVDLLDELGTYVRPGSRRRPAAGPLELRDLLRIPRVAARVEQVRNAARAHHEDRRAGPSDAFRLLTEMTTLAYARTEAARLDEPYHAPPPPKPDPAASVH
jgi:tetratricopeptide (TPR) repeat protein